MPYNQRTITLKLQRIDVCDLLLACTAVETTSEAEKWRALHDKLEAILKDFDEKNAQ